MTDVLLLITTFPGMATARHIADALLERRLIACATLLPGAESRFHWQGKLETSSEAVALMKTTWALLPSVEEALTALHPYDTPELLAFPAEAGAGRYLDWVAASVQATDNG